MSNEELGNKIVTEMSAFPVFTQNIVKGALEAIKKEITEGKVLLSDMFKDEDTFVKVLSVIIDIETNTGIFDPIDRPLIEKAVKIVVVGALKKAFGEDWLEDIRKMVA